MNSCIIFVPATEYSLGVCGFYKNSLEELEFSVKNVCIHDNPDISGDIRSVVENCRFFLSFDGDGAGLTVNGEESLYDHVKLPLISLCSGEIPELSLKTPRIIMGLRNMREIAMSYFFAPFPGLCLDGDIQRDIDVMFYYDLRPVEAFREQWRYDRAMTQICESMLEIMLSEEFIAPSRAFDMVMESSGIYLQSFRSVKENNKVNVDEAYSGKMDLRSVCIRLTTGFMENRRRKALLDTLRQAQVDVTVFSGLSFNEYLKSLKRAKIVISAGAAQNYSLPEQMACAMASGAVAAGDTNAFTAKIFRSNDYIMYSHGDYPALADRIKETLSSPSKLSEIAENGRRVIQSAYSPAHAAKRIIEMADYSSLLHR